MTLATPNNSKLVQAGAVGLCFALIGFQWLMYQTNVRTAEKMTELVEVTRALGPSIGGSIELAAETKTSKVLAAIQASCQCSRKNP